MLLSFCTFCSSSDSSDSRADSGLSCDGGGGGGGGDVSPMIRSSRGCPTVVSCSTCRCRSCGQSRFASFEFAGSGRYCCFMIFSPALIIRPAAERRKIPGSRNRNLNRAELTAEYRGGNTVPSGGILIRLCPVCLTAVRCHPPTTYYMNHFYLSERE